MILSRGHDCVTIQPAAWAAVQVRWPLLRFWLAISEFEQWYTFRALPRNIPGWDTAPIFDGKRYQLFEVERLPNNWQFPAAFFDDLAAQHLVARGGEREQGVQARIAISAAHANFGRNSPQYQAAQFQMGSLCTSHRNDLPL